MRAVLTTVLLAAGCAELGVVSDGTSVSVGKASRGYLIDGARLPDSGEGFTTRDVWLQRGNRYGTDELIDLVTNVARRMSARAKDVRLVVADLSGQGGGGGAAFHRSHQSGRDVDLLYYMRDAQGKPFEPDAMHVFSARGWAKDGSGIHVDVPRTWQLVKELVEAPEAPVQYIFMYEPIAELLIDHAKQIHEPESVIVHARLALKQPGDSARHDDHMHVRIYCSPADRQLGCVDLGPMELLAERESHTQDTALALIAGAVSRPVPTDTGESHRTPLPPDQAALGAVSSTSASLTGASTTVLRSLLRDRFDLRGLR